MGAEDGYFDKGSFLTGIDNNRIPHILVLGGINMGLITKASRMPSPGETLRGDSFYASPGGKGATQAVAASRLNSEVKMIGKVGNDIFAEILRENLKNNGVDITNIATDPNKSTGVGVIIVNSNSSQNHIIATYGANLECSKDQVEIVTNLISWADILVLQMEIPFDISIQAAMIAKEHGVTVILDPAPATKIPTSSYKHFDVITPNQTEAKLLTGITVHDKNSAKQAAKVLFKRGTPIVIIKIGEQGVYYLTKDESDFVPPFKVNAVDTTSAGDAFSGALAVCIAEKKPIKESIVFSSAAGAIAVTKLGVQDSMPYSTEIDALRNNNNL